MPFEGCESFFFFCILYVRKNKTNDFTTGARRTSQNTNSEKLKKNSRTLVDTLFTLPFYLLFFYQRVVSFLECIFCRCCRGTIWTRFNSKSFLSVYSILSTFFLLYYPKYFLYPPSFILDNFCPILFFLLSM